MNSLVENPTAVAFKTDSIQNLSRKRCLSVTIRIDEHSKAALPDSTIASSKTIELADGASVEDIAQDLYKQALQFVCSHLGKH